MSLKVIKCVAGSGKTTYAYEYMQNHKNGLYLAFNKDIVCTIFNKGVLSKTIDSFFQSYLFPKLISIIPLIGSNKKISYIEVDELPLNLKGIANIKISSEGDICNRNKNTGISLTKTNDYLHSRDYFPSSALIKYIFAKNELRLTHSLRSNLASYLIKNYPDYIIDLIASRFSYIIIDEAQDLRGFTEEFGKLIFNSHIDLILLGDENQNLYQCRGWFESLSATDTRTISYRCPENNCKWIRENLQIEIYGNDQPSSFNIIKWDEVLNLDDTKRYLLYATSTVNSKKIIANWKGPKNTIKSAKGLTIDSDIVIIGKTLNNKNLYTAITRTRRNVYSTIALNKK